MPSSDLAWTTTNVTPSRFVFLPFELSSAGRHTQVVGILSQGSSTSAYVMGISTAKTILRAQPQYLERIYDLASMSILFNAYGGGSSNNGCSGHV